MGVTYSMADSSPPPMPNFSSGPLSPAVTALLKEAAAAPAAAPAVDYLALPPPVKYEEIQRECLMALKPDLFEGLRFDISRPLNPNFSLSHNLFMGNMEVRGANTKQILKVPTASYEFGANVVTDGFLMLGRIATDGRLSGRLRYDAASWLALKASCQLSADPQEQSQLFLDADVVGAAWNAQVKCGPPSFVSANYFQAVTPALSAGGECFLVHDVRQAGGTKSGVGLALRHTGPAHISTMQLATTGILSLQYLHKVNEKVALATDLLWHWGARDATATVGYDVTLRHSRVRGKVDTNGVMSTFLEERLAAGISMVFSAEIDHWNSNYKFGFGITAGE